MGTKTFNNYEDLLTFTRASNGHALRPVSYGSEEVTNGTFDTDSDWVKTQATISGGVCEINSPSGSYAGVYQAIPVTVGKMYFISVEVVSVVTGSALVNVEGGSVGTLTTSGFITTAYVATDNTLTVEIKRGGGVTEFTIDNVSVKEVTFDESDGTLTLFEHPNNVPRVEWDADRNRLGLLVEEQRTNLDTQSTYFAGAASVTATKNYTAPDGSQDASTLDYTAVSTPYLNTTNISFSSGTTYSFSFYFKRGTGTQAVQTLLYGSTFNSGGANCVVVFDLDNETTSFASGTFVSHSITNVGGGWYRCMCSATATATASQNQQILRLGAADDGNYDYIFGKQVEVGSFPTSYIKSNSGSTTTRSADVASIPVADFGYNQSEGTVVATFEAQDTTSQQQFILGTDSGSARWLYSNSGGSDIFNFDGATTSSATGWVAGSISKAATSTDQSGKSLVVNGGSVATSTTNGNIASLPDTLFFGSWAGTSAILNGHIKSIQYYPRRLTNAQLQELTS